MLAKYVLAAIACTGCTTPPPFAYELTTQAQSARTVILHLDFDDYDSSLHSGPHTVTVVEGGRSEDLTVSVGICRPYTCTGGLELESVVLSLDTGRYPDNIRAFYCKGEDGSIESGIDTTRLGACK